MKEEKENIKTLIEIISYLLLSIAFFSSYAAKREIIDFIIILPFLFGIISIFFLYTGLICNNRYSKGFGYFLAVSFILTLVWLVLNIIRPDRNFLILFNPIDSTTICVTSFISLIVIIGCVILKKRKK